MAVTRKNNVIISTANSDTVSGPLMISNIKVNNGSASAATATLTIGSTVVYNQQAPANSSPVSDYCNIMVGGGDTLTFGVPASCTIYIYLADDLG